MRAAFTLLPCLPVATPIVTEAAEVSDPAIRQAQELSRADQAGRAVEILEDIVASNQGNATTHYWLSRAYGEVARSASMSKAMSLARKADAEFVRAVTWAFSRQGWRLSAQTVARPH